ncbi:MAG: TolC family outer membrane protein [Alphaproteobacteria bacterium]|nr:TolC family outer membrane protein [Alphaproteobacteria bacterium]
MATMGGKLKKAVTLFFLCINEAAIGTSLQEAVLTALETNPSIGVDEANARASDIEIDTARAGYFPSLDIVQSTLGYQYVRIKNKAAPLSIPFDGHSTEWVTNPTVVLSQTIFDGLATPFAVERARKEAEAADSILGQTREQIAFSAVSTYVILLAQQRLLHLADENIKKHQDILEKVKKHVEAGISTIADIYQVQSRLDDAFIIRDRTIGQLENAVSNFIAVVGFKPDDLDSPFLPEEPLSDGLEVILSRTSQSNPSVVVEKNNLMVAEAALDQTLSPFMPTVQVQLDSNAPIYNANGTEGRQSNFTAQVVLNYNLYSGGRDLAKRKAQTERVVAAKKKLDVARRNALQVCRSAWAKYLSDQAQVQDSKKAVEVNTKLQRAYELQFELISRPLIDLLDAYVSYYRSQNDHINAQADAYINHALLLASMGNLESTFHHRKDEAYSEACLPHQNEQAK